MTYQEFNSLARRNAAMQHSVSQERAYLEGAMWAYAMCAASAAATTSTSTTTSK